MSHKVDTEPHEIRNSFQSLLNDRHGFGFQFRVLKETEELFNRTENRSVWRFLFSELPVQIQSRDTRIDFILTRNHSSGMGFYMICECKRANPSLSNWCFLKAPRTRRNRLSGDPLTFEYARLSVSKDRLRINVNQVATLTDAHHLGFEVRRANTKGQSGGETGQAIEDAITQVLRGLNGYVETLKRKPRLTDGDPMYFMPVIFTTARLWSSKANLESSDLATGKIDITQDVFEEVPWLWYQYPMSPGLKHSIAKDTDSEVRVEQYLEEEYIRSVAIVNASGIEDFLLYVSGEFF